MALDLRALANSYFCKKPRFVAFTQEIMAGDEKEL